MRAPLVLPSLLLASFAVGVLAGCKGNSIEGKWNVSGAESLLPGSTAVYEFAGGRATMHLDATYPQFGSAKISASGPYKLEGDKLTLELADVKVDDSKLNPMAKSIVASPQSMETLKKSFQENKEFTLKFDSSDQALLTGKNFTVTLTRVK